METINTHKTNVSMPARFELGVRAAACVRIANRGTAVTDGSLAVRLMR